MEGQTIVKIPILQKLTFRILPYLPDTQVINGLHINGQRERAMGYNLDGLGAKEPVTGAVGSTNRVVTSSIDAISEVKAYATGMPAEFGHTAGGGLSVVFRSGTNQLHGSAEDRYLNNTLLHRDYFDTHSASARDLSRDSPTVFERTGLHPQALQRQRQDVLAVRLCPPSREGHRRPLLATCPARTC